MIEVRPCTIAEIEAAPNLGELLDEYGQESAMAEIGQPKADLNAYRALEASGTMHPIAAFDGALVVGFILPLVLILPHYSARNAVVESVFVSAEYRPAGVFNRLKAAAQQLCAELGASALIFSAAVGSRFDQAMALEAERGNCRHSNNAYVVAL